MILKPEDVADIQARYHYLVNYESDDPNTPIDPATYVDSNGDHLLHIAAQLGDLKTVEMLVEAGQDVDQTGDMGCTALHYAKRGKRIDVERYLIARWARTDISNDFGKLPGEM